MTDKAWFFYERDFSLRWCPVVRYDDDKPRAKKHEENMMSMVFEVPSDCLDEDGSARFGELQRRFPAPKEKTDESA